MPIQRGHSVSILVADGSLASSVTIGQKLQQSGYIYIDSPNKQANILSPIFDDNDEALKLATHAFRKDNTTIFLALTFPEALQIIEGRDDLVAVFLDGTITCPPKTQQTSYIAGGDVLFFKALERDCIREFFCISNEGRFRRFMKEWLRVKSDRGAYTPCGNETDIVANIDRIAIQYNMPVGGVIRANSGAENYTPL